MAWVPFRPVTADTTRVTADNAVSRPLAGMAARLQLLFPPAWSSTGAAPIRDALFTGCAAALAFVDALSGYTKLQTRLATATGLWLDLAAYDFFGLRFPRRKGEADAAFSKRLRAEIIRPRSTRAAIASVVQERTGIAPDIFEPFNPGDTGAYRTGSLGYGTIAAPSGPLAAYRTPNGGYGAGDVCYGVPPRRGASGSSAGFYGSLRLPNQMFVTIHRGSPVIPGIGDAGAWGGGGMSYGGGLDGKPSGTGYRSPNLGYGAGDASYGLSGPPYERSKGSGYYFPRDEAYAEFDADICDAITRTASAGVIVWVRFKGA